jgi:hypothetical protein
MKRLMLALVLVAITSAVPVAATPYGQQPGGGPILCPQAPSDADWICACFYACECALRFNMSGCSAQPYTTPSEVDACYDNAYAASNACLEDVCGGITTSQTQACIGDWQL